MSSSTVIQYIYLYPLPGGQLFMWSLSIHLLKLLSYLRLQLNYFNHLFTIRKCNKDKNSVIMRSLSISTLFDTQLALAFNSKLVMQQLWIWLNMKDTGAISCICCAMNAILLQISVLLDLKILKTTTWFDMNFASLPIS